MVPVPSKGAATSERRKPTPHRKHALSTSIAGPSKVTAGPSKEVLMQQRDEAAMEEDEDEDIAIETTISQTAIIDDVAEPAGAPEALFKPLSETAAAPKLEGEKRLIPIPPHRMGPLQKEWVNIFTPLTEMLGLQVRMNLKRKAVEMRTSKFTKEVGAIQKGADYVKAFALGFLIADAIALLRLDDLYLDSFETKDVKSLSGDHLSRAIGRIAGHNGKTKFTIENTTRTRIILADTKIHIMGSFQNIRLAKDAIVNLIMGSPPGKVYASLRTVASRLKQRSI